MDLDSPILSLALTPAQVDPSRPGADVHPGASVDPKVGSLGRYATISDGASIGKGAVVGPYAYIGPNVVIGDFVHVGAFAIVEQGSILEWGASVGDYAFLSANTHMRPGSSISTGAGTGMNTQIGTGADIGAGSLIGEGVVIGDWVNAGPLVDIRDFAEVAPEVQLAEGSRIFSGVYQDQDLSLCSVDMEGTNAGPANLCSLLGGAVIGQIGYPGVLTGMPAPGTRVTPIDPDNLPVALGSLAEDVEETRPTTPYSEEYDCDDFASDLEIALEGLDYDATFTCYWQRNPNRHWYNFYKEPLWLSGHCVTDVHDGEDLIWVEPQTGEVGIDLDFDGDGKVEFSSAHGSATTEDGYRVEVYDSRASAEAAGVQMD
jgi:acetyltransferase-like isoleucine patch superfamily enzyme